MLSLLHSLFVFLLLALVGKHGAVQGIEIETPGADPISPAIDKL